MNNYFVEKLHEIDNDAEQFAAYNSDGNTVVLAGPGSGKTTVLTLKVMQILHEKVAPPRGLACITYSKEAAREFKTRLNDYGLIKRENVFLGTVHSFCLSEIIIPFANLYPRYNIPLPIKIIPSKEKRKIIEQIKKEIEYEDLSITEIDKERTRNVIGLSKVDIPSYDVALTAANMYDKELVERGYIDFVSIIIYATLLLQNEEYVRRCIEAKFPWLVIDEYQDLGKPLHEMILSLLENTNIKIFAVGDADQSIYDFQGASPEYLIELSKMHYIKNCIHLKNNYRSAKDIIVASEAVLNKVRDYKAMGNLKDFPAKILFITCEEDMLEQYLTTLELVQDLISNDTAPHEIVILAAYHYQLKELNSIFGKSNIECYMAKHDFERSDLIKWLEKCASWTLNMSSESFDAIYTFWESLNEKHDRLILPDNKIEYKRDLYNCLINSKNNTASLRQWIEFVIEKLDILYLLNKSTYYPDEIENLNELMKLLITEPFTEYRVDQFSRLGSPTGQVVLSTRHGVKGLEFDNVIMLGMEEGSFPRYNCTERELEEAHRLCFVCVSRARKRCILIRSKYLNIPTRRGMWHKECNPSRFWDVLYSQYNEE